MSNNTLIEIKITIRQTNHDLKVPGSISLGGCHFCHNHMIEPGSIFRRFFWRRTFRQCRSNDSFSDDGWTIRRRFFRRRTIWWRFFQRHLSDDGDSLTTIFGLSDNWFFRWRVFSTMAKNFLNQLLSRKPPIKNNRGGFCQSAAIYFWLIIKWRACRWTNSWTGCYAANDQ